MEIESQTPCTACGWTTQKQHRCGYVSHVKLFYGASDRGAWALGSNFILKERPKGPPNHEAINLKFLRENTTIPVPKVVKEWVDDEGSYFVLMERIKGQTLEAAWSIMSTADKERVADQTADCLLQLRRFRSARIKSPDGGPVYSGFLFLAELHFPHGPYSSDEELWQDMAAALKKLPEKARERFRKRMPKSSPYTFTHGDLTNVNIMVEDGNLTGIIDWEAAGYFPAWWEFTAAGIGLGIEDAEWKALLRARMTDYTKERQFWRDFYAIHSYPSLNERGEALLKELLEG
ncbi:MAG: hypothetical protein M1830_002287 [Pleopsidium flavum]|nr:MAG: hypothetical protein M1830_002287 [Pleopsidium flavum]